MLFQSAEEVNGFFRINKPKPSLNYYSCSVRSLNNVWKEFNCGKKRNETGSVFAIA